MLSDRKQNILRNLWNRDFMRQRIERGCLILDHNLVNGKEVKLKLLRESRLLSIPLNRAVFKASKEYRRQLSIKVRDIDEVREIFRQYMNPLPDNVPIKEALEKRICQYGLGLEHFDLTELPRNKGAAPYLITVGFSSPLYREGSTLVFRPKQVKDAVFELDFHGKFDYYKRTLALDVYLLTLGTEDIGHVAGLLSIESLTGKTLSFTVEDRLDLHCRVAEHSSDVPTLQLRPGDQVSLTRKEDIYLIYLNGDEMQYPVETDEQRVILRFSHRDVTKTSLNLKELKVELT